MFNTDKGRQFTNREVTQIFEDRRARTSMDWKGQYSNNMFVEQLWRTAKYLELHLKTYPTFLKAQRGPEDYFRFYNGLRLHQALEYRPPAEVFQGDKGGVEGGFDGRRGAPGQGMESLKTESESSLNAPQNRSK